MPEQTKFVTNIWQGGGATYRDWVDLNRLSANDGLYSRCGANIIASASGTRSKPSVLAGNTCAFNIHLNARIDYIIAQIETYVKNPTGGCTGRINIPYVDFFLYYANGGANSSTKRYGASVPCSAVAWNRVWYLSEIPNCKPVHVNSASFGANISAGRNVSSNPGYMYMDYIALIVGWTEPTYSLNATITSSVVVGEYVYYSITLNNTNGVHQGYNIPVSIPIPSGLSYVSQSGNGTYNTGTGKWDAVLSGGSATLNLVLQATSTGNKTVTGTVDYTGTNISKTVNVLAPSYVLTSNNPEFADEATNFVYNLTIETNSSTETSKNVTIPVPDGCSYVSYTGDGTYTSGTGVWAASFTDQEASIAITFLAQTAGETSITATVEGGAPVDTSYITILETDVTIPFSVDYSVPDSVLTYLSDAEAYALSWYCKVADTSLTSVYTGEKNHKIGVLQDAVETLSDRPTLLDTWTRCDVDFIHDVEAELMLRLYGQYLEISPSTSTTSFAGFRLSSGTEIIYIAAGTVFDYPDNLIGNGDYALASIPANASSLPIRFNDINWAGRDEDPNLIVKGFAIEADYQVEAETTIITEVTINDITKSKSFVFQAGDGTAIFGGSDDNWEFGSEDILSSAFEFTMEFMNNTASLNDVMIKNVRVVLFTQYDSTFGNPGFTLDGVHSKNYDIFLVQDIDKDEGGKIENRTLDLKGSDGIFIVGTDIKEKELTLKFKITGDDLEDAQDRVNSAVAWMSPIRNSVNMPVTKDLVFDWDDDKTYKVVLDDVVQTKMDIATYECTVKFLIPSGVALSDIITSGNVGTNSGIISSKPVITATVTATGAYLELVESETGQTLIIRETSIPVGTVLTIDVENKTITGSDENTYQDSVSLDSTWPLLVNNFDFRDSVGMVINSVVYREGY